MRHMDWKVGLVACMVLANFAGPTPPQAMARPAVSWTLVESENFRLYSMTQRQPLEALAATCEATRAQLAKKWFGRDQHPVWDIKCQIVLHPTAASYLREVGQGQMTAGSSLIEFGADRLVTRRIDLRADHPQGYADALAHELTHVVIAERFIERQIPRWADEGMAVLADGQTKQALHLADLARARSDRTMFRLVELMNLEQYPSLERQGTFYGQSVSVVKYLVDRGGPQQFVEFVSRSTTEGCETALRRTYGIETLGELERAWLASLDQPAGTSHASSESGGRAVALKNQ